MIRRIATCAPALSLFGFSPALRAQAGQATLTGTVTDPTGAIIPAAAATLIQESSHVQRTATADKNGNIAFVAIPPDTYDIQITAPGFRPIRQNGIAVHINDQLDLRTLALTPAGNDVSVTVTTDTGDVTLPPKLKIFSFYAPSGTPLTLSGVSSIDPSTNPGVVYGSADPNDHATPVTYSWNLALSHVFPAAIHLETSYVGNTTRHLNGYYAANLVPLGSETTKNDGGPYFGGNYYQQLNRPYKSPGDIGYNTYNTHNLGSNYHSLQVTASRNKGWFNTWLTYTFGKALGDVCEDAFVHQNCYSLQPYDRSQAVNLSYYIVLPSVSAKYMGKASLRTSRSAKPDVWNSASRASTSSTAPSTPTSTTTPPSISATPPLTPQPPTPPPAASLASAPAIALSS